MLLCRETLCSLDELLEQKRCPDAFCSQSFELNRNLISIIYERCQETLQIIKYKTHYK